MPRYFFHLRSGRRLLQDEEGIELRDRTAARDEALAVVRDLANPDVEGTQRRWSNWLLEVADERGGFFRKHIGHPALELLTPDHHSGQSGTRVEDCPGRGVPPRGRSQAVNNLSAFCRTTA
jgi:Domain of unknown function (DUF6894)